MFADLHLHTAFSDGTYSPEELVGHAQRHGLSALALTDHDTVEGCERMARACAAAGLEFVPGTEITAEADDCELHLLGYFIDPQNAALRSALEDFQTVRQNRIREIVARLRGLNLRIEEEAVFKLANCRAPGRPHVARALVQAGVCATLDEAFERFLKKNRPGWVPKPRISAAAATRLIHAAGGLAVMAHPGLVRNDALIPELVTGGLDGLECFHSKHSTATTEHYLEVAEHHGLLVTGGSDCHGMNKGVPLIGTIKLPYEHVEKMKAALAKRRTDHPTAALKPDASVPSLR